MTRQPPTLRARALAYLARREHSRAELQHKLARYTEDEAELARLLDDLQARGWLSEQRFVEQVIHARRGRYGSRRIAQELREKGVSDTEITRAVSAYKDADLEAARAIWQRRFGKPPKDALERARQMRFLQGRGFDMDVIRKVVQGAGDDT